MSEKTDLETITEMLLRQKISFATNRGDSLIFGDLEMRFDSLGRILEILEVDEHEHEDADCKDCEKYRKKIRRAIYELE